MTVDGPAFSVAPFSFEEFAPQRPDGQEFLPEHADLSASVQARAMVDDPRDALECFGSSPIDALVMGPFVVRRGRAFARRDDAEMVAAR